ncbi:hypothetical protein WJX77_007927 [Trebouxia sp. C0004]
MAPKSNNGADRSTITDSSYDDDLPYGAITAMLTSHSFSDLQHPVQDDNRSEQVDPATASAVPTKPQPVASISASPAAGMNTGHTFWAQAHSDANLAGLDLPSAPQFPVLPKSSQKPSTAVPDTEEALFARLTALKSSSETCPAVSLDVLNDRLSALKGPKAAPADMHDLESRLDILKGRDKISPSLLELESRLSKLRGSLGPPKGKPVPGNAVPDYDPVVELNEQQLDALASMSDHHPNITDAMSDELAADSPFSPCADFTLEHHANSSTFVMSKAAQQTAASTSVPETSDSIQMMQDSAAEAELSHEQLLALANMPFSSTAAIPAWTAGLGLSARDLRHDSVADEATEVELATRQGAQQSQQGRTGRSKHQNMPQYRRL